ncbi:MAG: DMT family transporter [Spirochaetales bacterium]|jgi:drug/metabolite transporter (DMT)-like permease|nr:DMT family transporter [Spirochaetales bacterium]
MWFCVDENDKKRKSPENQRGGLIMETGGESPPGGPSGGLLNGILSGLCFALYSLLAAGAMGLPPLAGEPGFFAAPLGAAGINDGLSALLLFIHHRRKGRRGIPGAALKTRHGRLVILGALAGGPLANTLYLAALKTAGTQAMPISALYPLFGCLFARLFLKQGISLRILAGMGICVLGAALVSLTGPPEPGLSAGWLCALLAAAGWGLDGVCSAYAMEAMPPGAILLIRQSLSGFTLLFLALPLLGSWSLPVRTAAFPLTVLCLLGSSCFTVLSYLNWYRANHRLGVAGGMALNGTYIFWGAALSALWFRRLPSRENALGMILTLGGMALIALGRGKPVFRIAGDKEVR